MISAKISKFIFGFAILAILGGCANTNTLKVSEHIFDGKSVVLVPTGGAKIQGSSSTIGGSLGLIGAFIELAQSIEMRNNAKIVEEKFGPDKIMAIFSANIESNIQKLGKISTLKIDERTKINTEFTDWYNLEIRTDNSNGLVNSSDLIIEYGFQFLSLNNYLIGTFAEGGLGIKVIDAKSGKVIARAREFLTNSKGVLINLPKDDPKYYNDVQAAFSELIQKLTLRTINKLTN